MPKNHIFSSLIKSNLFTVSPNQIDIKLSSFSWKKNVTSNIQIQFKKQKIKKVKLIYV